MLVSVDKQGNRIYADSSGVRYTECYCPVCGESVVHKLGKQRRAHFSHRADTNCYFGRDKDYKSEWHIRMQNYFPKEAQEFIFVDKETGEKFGRTIRSNIPDYNRAAALYVIGHVENVVDDGYISSNYPLAEIMHPIWEKKLMELLKIAD